MQLVSAMINISWFCDFHANPETACPYCWVTMAEKDRSRNRDVPAESWLEAIRKQIPTSAVLDFVGGEPTAFPKFHWLVGEIASSHRWAVTSNMGGDRWRKYIEQPIKNCVSWTASYHPSGKDSLVDFSAKCLELAPSYPLSVNIVDYPTHDAKTAADSLRKFGLKVYVSPFENIRRLNVPGRVPLSCNGGHTHIVIDPQGFVYKCLTQQRRADQQRWRLGNIFKNDIAWPQKRSICFIPCDQFYTLDRKHATRDMWSLDVREIEIPASCGIEAYQGTFVVPPSLRKDYIQNRQQ